MKRILLLSSLLVISGISFSQEKPVEVTYTTLNAEQKKHADHWGMDEEEWLFYEEYMELEGKYFYEKVDPLTVMALNTSGKLRESFIAKQILFERAKIKKEMDLANDTWRIQVGSFGNEPMMDFRSLPWINAEEEDWRLYKHPNTYDSIMTRQLAEKETSPYQDKDEIWIFLGQECNDCKQRLNTLKNEQPLNVSVYPLLENLQDIDSWVKSNDLTDIFKNSKMKLQIYNPNFFDEQFTPKAEGIYHARQGNIIREL